MDQDVRDMEVNIIEGYDCLVDGEFELDILNTPWGSVDQPPTLVVNVTLRQAKVRRSQLEAAKTWWSKSQNAS